MKISRHAITRFKQRGIPTDLFDLLLLFGNAEEKPGNVYEIRLGKEGKNKALMHLKYLIQGLDKLGHKAILVDGEMTEIITAYNII